MSQESKGISINELLKELGNLRMGRENQLNKEAHLSYNYGYVAGEISGINKAITLISKYNFVTGD